MSNLSRLKMMQAKFDPSEHPLVQSLRRVMELNELKVGDLVLVVAQLGAESETDPIMWHAGVFRVASSKVEDRLHWAIRLEGLPDEHIYADVMDPGERANGQFASGGGYWVTQVYRLSSRAEIDAKAKPRCSL